MFDTIGFEGLGIGKYDPKKGINNENAPVVFMIYN